MKKSKHKQKPIPANVAAIWGAFLYEGMLACTHNKGRERDVLAKWAKGCDELIAAACAFLPELWRQIEPRWYEAQFPGVFEYEVVSPLGVALGDYILISDVGNLPTKENVQEFIQDLIQDFFRAENKSAVLEKLASGKAAA